MVAFKLMRGSWRHSEEQRCGLTSCQFIRLGLLRLQLGHGLKDLTYGGKPRDLTPVDEVLAPFPELAPPA